MSTNPIDGIGRGAVSPVSTEVESPVPTTSAKPTIKPPLERPFSLSLPLESTKPAAEAIVKNITASNKETERLTKMTADEQKLQQILEEQQAQDRLLNGPGTSGA
jgi:hypothetical protein